MISIRVKLPLLGAIEEAANKRHIPVSTLAAKVLADWCVAQGLLRQDWDRVAGS